MSVKFINFSVGERTFQMNTLQPFTAVQHSLKLKKILEKGLNNGLDSNVVSMLGTIDEKTMETVIFPILADVQLTCTSAEKKLQSSKDFNELYSIDDMDEFFIAVWEVLKANFGPFFQKLAKNLFGLDLSSIDMEKVRAMVKNAIKKVKADSDKSPSDLTSSQNGLSGASSSPDTAQSPK